MTEILPSGKSEQAYKTISEAAGELNVATHVLRFWESKFPTKIKPLKRRGGRRYYGSDDMENLRLIQRLLHQEGYTIRGVQKLFKSKTEFQAAKEAVKESQKPVQLSMVPEPDMLPDVVKSEIRAIIGELQKLRTQVPFPGRRTG